MERPCESCDFVSGLHFSLPDDPSQSATEVQAEVRHAHFAVKTTLSLASNSVW